MNTAKNVPVSASPQGSVIVILKRQHESNRAVQTLRQKGWQLGKKTHGLVDPHTEADEKKQGAARAGTHPKHTQKKSRWKSEDTAMNHCAAETERDKGFHAAIWTRTTREHINSGHPGQEEVISSGFGLG